MCRGLCLVGLFLSIVSTGLSQQPKSFTRLGMESDDESFPQATPKELVGSILKAVDRQKFDYLAAHLMDPGFVDARLQRTNQKLEEFSKEIRTKFQSQPEVTRELMKILGSGEILDSGTTAVIKHKEIPNTQVFLKKVGDRWYIENRQKDDKPKE